MKRILLSVKPRYAEKILNGSKKIELRRRFTKLPEDGVTVVIYASSPISSVIGAVEVHSVEKLRIKEIWSKYKEIIGIDELGLHKYFRDIDEGLCLHLRKPMRFKNSKPLNEIFDGSLIRPPQSFQFVSDDFYLSAAS